MNKFIKWLGNNSTNILATIYVIIVQIITPIFYICKIWFPGKEWPTKCLIGLDKPAKVLREMLAKKKAEDAKAKTEPKKK